MYVAIALLAVIASIWAPATLRGPGLSSIAPFGTFLAITALGQMLVIMTGGIDLSVPGTLTLAAVVTVGVGQGSDERIWTAIGVALVLAAVVGLVNGILIGGLGLNALIVTLAVGQIVSGIAFRYYSEVAIQTPVPDALSAWTSTRFLGVTRTFWMGVAITLVLIVLFRFTTPGRRFQVVGANPTAASIAGLRVNLNQMLGLRGGRGPLRHGGDLAGVVPRHRQHHHRRSVPPGPDRRRGHRRRLAHRWVWPARCRPGWRPSSSPGSTR